jgi:hypothetical protein
MMKSNSRSIALAIAFTTFAATVTGCGSSPMVVAPSQLTSINPGAVMSGGCVPLNQPIGFQATNLSTDNFQSVFAGKVPSVDTLIRGGGSFGQVTQSAGGTVAPVAGSRTIQTMANRIDGSFVMNIAAAARTGNGVITLSPTKLSIIYGLFGLNYPNVSAPYTGSVPAYGFPTLGSTFNTPGTTPTQVQAQTPCVSGIAVSISFASLMGNYIDGGRVYLYLNGTQHGDYLQF